MSCRVKRAHHKGLQVHKVSGGGEVNDTERGLEVTWGWHLAGRTSLEDQWGGTGQAGASAVADGGQVAGRKFLRQRQLLEPWLHVSLW